MKKNQFGFTITELLITIAVLAILASLAVPTMISTVRNNQLNQEVSKVTENWAKTRATALLEKRTTLPASYVIGDKVKWDNTKRPATQPRFNYMGFVVDNNGRAVNDSCFILQHQADTSLQRVILLSRNGSVSAPRNLTTCP